MTLPGRASGVTSNARMLDLFSPAGSSSTCYIYIQNILLTELGRVRPHSRHTTPTYISLNMNRRLHSSWYIDRCLDFYISIGSLKTDYVENCLQFEKYPPLCGNLHTSTYSRFMEKFDF